MNAYSNGISVILNCTFAANADNAGKAIYYYNTEHPLQVMNCIVMDGIRYYGWQPAVSYSFVQGMAANTANHNLDGNANPYFTNTATGDYRLTVNSPAINAGNNLVQLPCDLAGYPRVYDPANGGVIDIGAYEYQGNPIQPDANGIMYVDSAAALYGDGSSWATALPKLSDALHYARTNAANWASDSLRIYVAKGTYLPEYRADDSSKVVNDRNAAFVMVKNVQLFGGFPNDGGVRNWAVDPAVLSGDIGTANDAADNAYHVVISVGDVGNALLNGFTITKGNANGSGSIIINNQSVSANRGGGILNNSSSPALKNVTISNNSAKYGGGMLNLSSSPSFVNTTISNNSAQSYGGGMYNHLSSPTIVNTTISNNSAETEGGGMYNYSSSPAINNSIVFGNRPTDPSGFNIFNSVSTPVFKNSLVGGTTSWKTYWGTDGGNNIITTTNSFADTATGNYQLIASSPAINAGSNALYTDAGGNLANDKDLAGNVRVYNETSGGIIDMGAYESQTEPVTPGPGNILYVNQNVSGGNGSGDSWENAIPELADALKRARQQQNTDDSWLQNDSLRIFIAKGIYKPLYSAEDGSYTIDAGRGNAFVMVKNVQLYGGFPNTGDPGLDDRDWNANPTILSGDIGTTDDFTDNTYHVVVFSGDAGNAGLNGLIISGGNADVDDYISVNGSDIYQNRGGGMYINNHSSPTISNTTISNNSANNGAGMINYNYSSPAILNMIISNNSAKYGGGMSNYTHSSPIISNTTISDNSANNGGGMNNFQSSPAILNTTISNNLAQTSGGGIYNDHESSPAINNSIIFGNRLTDASVSNIANSSTFGIPVFKNSLVGGATSWNTDWGADGGNNIVTTNNPFADTANGDFSLIPGPAVDGGSNTLYTDAGGDLANDKDLAGNPRVYDLANGGMVDMGAYEFQDIVAESTKITLQPKDSKVCEGDAASFSISATGTNLTYQWQQLSTDNSATWNNVPAATTAILTIPNTTSADSGFQYRTIVAGDRGTDTSASATLHVNALVLISMQPHDTTVLAGENAAFSIAVTGTVSGYQWQVSTSTNVAGMNWNNINGETNSTLYLSNSAISLNGHQYRAIATGNCNSDTSASATLTVDQPVLTLRPAALPAGYANVLYPTVTFSASGGTGAYTYTETGALPNGMTFADGILSGTPSQSGSFPISITAEDHSATNIGGPFLATKNYTLVINTGGSCITINSYPHNTTVCEGSNASFSIDATGATGYQWQSSSNGGSNWTDIHNETNATLSLTNVMFSETPEQYHVIVKSNCGDITSGSATLRVGANATIITQPKDAAVCENGNAIFNVSAAGTNLTYQWQSSTSTDVGGTNWDDVPNGTSETLNLSNIGLAKNETEYHVIVSSDCGTVTSASAKLSVRPNTTITTQPQDVTASEGGNGTFSVVAIGAVSYQWKSSVDGNIWKILDGETTTSLKLSNISASADGTKYIVVVTGASGIVTSEIATLSVTANPVITFSPGTLPDAAIGTAYSTTITADGGAAPYSYELNGALPAGISFNAATGEFSGTPTEAGTFNGITIKATDKNNFSGSRIYSLTVNPPVLTLDPASLPFSFAGIPYSRTFTANGGSAPYTYSVSGTLPTNITLNEATGVLSGTTNETGTFSNIQITATDASTGTGAPFTVSKTYTLVINGGGSCIAITSAPQNQTVCEGSDAAFSIAATGAKDYQWESSIDGGSHWQTITGATGSTLSLTDVLFSERPVQYHVIVHSSCGDITSGSATLTVRANAAIITQPEGATACENGNTSFSVTATGTNVTYQWQSSTSTDVEGTTWNNVTTSGTSATLNITGVSSSDNGTEYHVIVSSDCGNVTSAPAMLTVNAVKHTTLNETICNGSVYNFGGIDIGKSGTYHDTLSAATGCDSIVVLNLQVRSEIKTILNETICFGSAYNFGGENISQSGTYSDTLTSATGCDSIVVLSLTVGPEIKTMLNETICEGSVYTVGTHQYAQPGTYHDTLHAASGCDSVVVLHLTVNTNTAITAQPSGATADIGGNATFSVVATGTITGYQWQSSGDGGMTWNDETNGTTKTLGLSNIGTALNGFQYRVIAKGAFNNDTSATARLMVNMQVAWDNPDDSLAPGYEDIPYSDSITATDGTGSAPTYTAEGTLPQGVTFDPKTGSLSGTPTDTGSYPITITVTFPAGHSDTTYSQTKDYTIVVEANGACIHIAGQPRDLATCEGSKATFSIISTAVETGTTGYQWQSSSDGTTWKNVANATTKDLNIPSIQLSDNKTKYRVVVSNSCGYVTSDAATLKVNAKTTITTQPESQAVCAGGNITFRVKATGTDIKYQWQSSADGTTWNDVSGAVKPTLQPSDITTSDNGTQYHVIVSGTCDNVTSDNVTLTVNPLPDITITADSTNPVSKGDVVHLTASGADSYQWDFAAGIRGGMSNAVLQVRPAGNITYHVTGTTAAGCRAGKDYAAQVMTDYRIFANNIVSPNGDGKNDTWFIRNIDMYPNNEVMIYDRSGRMIYHKKAYDNRWNGMLNGGPLHEGTYYYVFKVDGAKRIFKGFIELLRDK